MSFSTPWMELIELQDLRELLVHGMRPNVEFKNMNSLQQEAVVNLSKVLRHILNLPFDDYAELNELRIHDDTEKVYHSKINSEWMSIKKIEEKIIRYEYHHRYMMLGDLKVFEHCYKIVYGPSGRMYSLARSFVRRILKPMKTFRTMMLDYEMQAYRPKIVYNNLVLRRCLELIVQRCVRPYLPPVFIQTRTRREQKDYDAVIKTPMDFEIVMEKINCECYYHAGEFIKDMRQIHINVKLYYGYVCNEELKMALMRRSCDRYIYEHLEYVLCVAEREDIYEDNYEENENPNTNVINGTNNEDE
ncbi:hypothetical protein ACOME3_004736 [Neoechinorhynchus agilis]